jgi:hypothetical protein
MGLRLVAHYYDRVEALIVSATLDAAGVPNWIENYFQNSTQPFHEIALGGYRVMVRTEDVSDALEIIAEARAAPVLEGGRLISRPVLWEPFAWLFVLLMLVWEWWGVFWILTFVIGVLLPVRRHEWHER